MKVKNLNLIERHVEKITLAVAAAGALWLLYQGFQPTTIAPQGAGLPAVLTADTLEKTVEDEVRLLEEAGKKVDKKSVNELKGDVPNYLEAYRRIHDKPLDTALVTAPVPRIGPLQSALSTIDPGNVQGERIVIVPKVPALENTTMAVGRGLVLVPGAAGAPAAPGLPIVPAGGAPVLAGANVQDINSVRLAGDFSVLALRESMNNIGGEAKQAVPVPYQRVTFVRIEVQRQEKVSGGWSTWELVAATKAAPLDLPNPDVIKTLGDDKINSVLDALDKDWKSIIMPAFYTPADGKALFPPLVPRVQTAAALADTATRLAEVNKRTSGMGNPGGGFQTPAPAFPGGPPPMGPGGMGGPPFMAPGGMGGPPVMAPGGGMVAPPGGPGAATPATVVFADLNAVRAQASIPVWFYDDTVKPSQSYRYQWRMVVSNPLYHVDKRVFKLTNPAAWGEPWLAGDWVAVTGIAEIKPNLSFFFSMWKGGGAGATPIATVQIYKWFQGGWYMTGESVLPGMTIGGERMQGKDKIDYSTHYTLVDVIGSDTNDPKVVLLSPSGELEMRSVKDDENSPALIDLRKKLVKAAVPPPLPGTGTPGTGTPGPGATPPTRPPGGGPPSAPPYGPGTGPPSGPPVRQPAPGPGNTPGRSGPPAPGN